MTNFRAFKNFRMSGLARINLLVGANNGGKTSVLEALHLLLAESPLEAAWAALRRRWELADGASLREIEVCHLFPGHELAEGSRIHLEAATDTGPIGTTLDIRAAAENSPRRRFRFSAGENPEFGNLEVQCDRLGEAPTAPIPLTTRNGLHADYIDAGERDGHHVMFLPAQGLSGSELASNYSTFLLTPDEDRVLTALRAVEPGLERIALTAGATTTRRPFATPDRGGFIALVQGKRVPIGSLGEGIWRALSIAASMVKARGGVLLIDEVDTGLHYSVMEPLWRFIDQTARSLDVQVFATTHSRDCIDSLATIARPGENEVSIHRIERDRAESVSFTDAEIRVAAERNLEVR